MGGGIGIYLVIVQPGMYYHRGTHGRMVYVIDSFYATFLFSRIQQEYGVVQKNLAAGCCVLKK